MLPAIVLGQVRDYELIFSTVWLADCVTIVRSVSGVLMR